jgi:predicted amidohydrolase YtcJ
MLAVSCGLADFNHNLFEIPESEIHKTEVQKTIFKGEVVYQID